MQREEIFKTQCIPNLIYMADKGELEDKQAAIGALGVLALAEKHITEVVNMKVSSNKLAMVMTSWCNAQSIMPKDTPPSYVGHCP